MLELNPVCVQYIYLQIPEIVIKKCKIKQTNSDVLKKKDFNKAILDKDNTFYKKRIHCPKFRPGSGGIDGLLWVIERFHKIAKKLNGRMM